MSNTESTVPLTKSYLIAYAGLALPLSIAFIPMVIYLPAFYAKEVGLSVGMVGLVFLLARLWDGMSDLIVGALSDRTHSRFGRRKPWVVVGAPLLMVATWYLCNPPKDVGLLYLGVWAALFYIAYTFVIVPYWSWGAELSTSYEERSRITGFREGGTMIGNVIVAAAPVLLLDNDAPVRDALLLITGLIIILLPLTTIPLAIAIKDPRHLSAPKVGYSQLFSALRKNQPLQRFLLAILCFSISLGVINSTGIFLIDIGFGLPGAFFLLFLIQYLVGVVSVPLVIRLGNRFNKHHLVAGSFVISIAYYLALSTLPTGHYYLIAGFVSISGITFACYNAYATSILADIVDYGTASSGEAPTGIYMALYNLTLKIGLALGIGLAYGFLDLIGFDPAAAAHTAKDVLKIRLTACVPTALLLIPAAYLLWNFPITREVQQELRRKIESQRDHCQQGSKHNTDADLSSAQTNSTLPTKSSGNTVLLPDNG